MAASAPAIDSSPARSRLVERVAAGGAAFMVERLGPEGVPLRLVWLHGWGQSRAALKPLAERFTAQAENLLIDLPGFGDAPPPPEGWGSPEYGAMLGEWLSGAGRSNQKTVLLCHSFGVRVALRLASSRPELVQGLVLIAGAGLRRKRSLTQRAKATSLRLVVRGAALVDGLARSRLAEHLRGRLGSADYRSAGPLRGVLVRVVNEDQSEQARAVQAPTLLIYGEGDDQTPPEFGTRFKTLIAGSELAILPGFDHYSIVSAGRHQVESLIRRFLAEKPGLSR